jgi:hypothetical protein
MEYGEGKYYDEAMTDILMDADEREMQTYMNERSDDDFEEGW